MHVVRARGKHTIVSLCKILNHFGSRYSVLHDCDTPRITVKDRTTGESKEQANSAWAGNKSIFEEVESAPDKSRVRLLASKPNFERAFLGYEGKQDKPYAAVQRLKENMASRAKIIELLHSLLDHGEAPPEGAVPTAEVLSQAESVELSGSEGNMALTVQDDQAPTDGSLNAAE